MSLDMKHSDIECTLRGKNSAEPAIVVAAAKDAARGEQPNRRPTDRVAATNEPTTVRIRKGGVISAPGLIEV